MKVILDETYKDLLKFDVFIFGVLLSTFLIYYNFNTNTPTAIFVSIMVMAFIFAVGLVVNSKSVGMEKED